MFEECYLACDDERAVFRDLWRGPMRFEHGKDALVARIAKTPANGDGYNVEIYCCALPSRFYTVKVLPTPNSMNEPRPGFTLSTGSGMAAFALQFAKHAAEGMLGMRADGVTENRNEAR